MHVGRNSLCDLVIGVLEFNFIAVYYQVVVSLFEIVQRLYKISLLERSLYYLIVVDSA